MDFMALEAPGVLNLMQKQGCIKVSVVPYDPKGPMYRYSRM